MYIQKKMCSITFVSFSALSHRVDVNTEEEDGDGGGGGGGGGGNDDDDGGGDDDDDDDVDDDDDGGGGGGGGGGGEEEDDDDDDDDSRTSLSARNGLWESEIKSTGEEGRTACSRRNMHIATLTYSNQA